MIGMISTNALGDDFARGCFERRLARYETLFSEHPSGCGITRMLNVITEDDKHMGDPMDYQTIEDQSIGGKLEQSSLIRVRNLRYRW